MEFISSLIPFFIIISIVVSIVSKAKNAQNNSQTKKTSQAQGIGASLQDIIRQQIEQQRNAVTESKQQTSAPQSPPKPVTFGEGNYVNQASLENRPTEMQRHTHDAHEGGSYNEGDALNRKTLEGTPTEMQRHSHTAHGGPSYNEGDALNRKTLEGSPIFEYEDKFSLDETAKVTHIKSDRQSNGTGARSNSLKLDASGIVNGIIMSEILNKRGGKRAIR